MGGEKVKYKYNSSFGYDAEITIEDSVAAVYKT